jgi:hypothetical protein
MAVLAVVGFGVPFGCVTGRPESSSPVLAANRETDERAERWTRDPSTTIGRGALPADERETDRWQLAVRDAALWSLRNPVATVRRDCSSLVMAILLRAGVRVSGGSASFWLDAQREGRVVAQAVPGDLAFFDLTYDANRNGRVDDELTHVAVVVAIEANGTVVMVHRGSGEIKELRMNLARPDVAQDEGRVLNDPLRSPAYGPRQGMRLAGQLFHGFARPPAP